MAQKEIKALDTLYFVNNTNKKVSLEIITGGIGQTSTVKAIISYPSGQNVEITSEGQDQLPPTEIDNNKALQNSTLVIACVITDTSRDTNYTELIIRLKGGILFREYPLTATVENEGDSVKYICLIHFYNPL